MIATIGLVFCAYVIARMLEMGTTKQVDSLARVFAFLVLAVAAIGAVLILRDSAEVARALDPAPAVSRTGAPMTEFGDTTAATTTTTDLYP
jgi:flagellar motor component MotA